MFIGMNVTCRNGQGRSFMTRRQAILQAIRILSSHPENDEIILKLQIITDKEKVR